MSESPADNEVETCQMAMEAAFEKGMGFCESEEARTEVLSQVVGLRGSERDFDLDERLEDGPGGTTAAVKTRQWVIARAEEIIESGDVEQPLDAVNQSWIEVSEKIAETEDPDPEDEPEAEAEAEPEPEPEDDE